MARTLSSGLLVLLCAAAFYARAADISPVPEALLGTWAMVGFVDNGETAPPEMLERARAVFAGNRMTLISPDGKEITEYTIRVDPTRTPRAMDLIRVEGTFAGQSSDGIYELNGETLRICAPLRPGTSRPKTFEASRDSGLFLLVFRKISN